MYCKYQKIILTELFLLAKGWETVFLCTYMLKNCPLFAPHLGYIPIPDTCMGWAPFPLPPPHPLNKSKLEEEAISDLAYFILFSLYSLTSLLRQPHATRAKIFPGQGEFG
jgi:hypothetical protein